MRVRAFTEQRRLKAGGSRGRLPHMALLTACAVGFSGSLSAAVVQGKVVDPSGAPIGGAQVSIVGRLGVVVQTTTTTAGTFELDSGNAADIRLVVTATGFRTRSVAPESAETVTLEIAPLVDSVQVIGSTIDVAAAEQGSSVSLVPSEDIRRRNEPMATDLLRYLPGVTVNQTGMRGGLTSFYLRGGNANLNLVQIDGAPVNGFGGAFDFAHIPSEALDHVEAIRGPQSAVYGSYANSGAVNFGGYAVFGLNLNYALGHGTTAYAHLRNAMNRRYEEVLGYPAPRLNFVAGMKWSIGRRK